MKKILLVMISSAMLLSVACGKEKELPEGPNIEWTDENIDKYLGTEVYCSYDSFVDFYENHLEDYEKVFITGDIAEISDNQEEDSLEANGTYIVVQDENSSDNINVYCDVTSFNVGDVVYVEGEMLPIFDRENGTQGYCIQEGAVETKNGDEEYISVADANRKMDKLYKDTKFKMSGQIRTTSDEGYKFNGGGEFDPIDGPSDSIYCMTRAASKKYSGNWVTITGEFYVNHQKTYGLWDTKVLEEHEPVK